MGIPRSRPSFASVRHKAMTSFSAVTPLTKDIWSAKIDDAGEKVVLTRSANASLKRFEPKGPS
jgi:hypothetical protein